MTVLMTLSLDVVLIIAAPFIGYGILRLLGEPKGTEIFPGLRITIRRTQDRSSSNV